jgi:hypothetical protein
LRASQPHRETQGISRNPNPKISGSTNLFLAKYAADGSLAWVTQVGGEPDGSAVGSAVAVAADGSAWVTGYFGRAAVFGAGEAHETPLSSADPYSPDALLATAVRRVRRTPAAAPGRGCLAPIVVIKRTRLPTGRRVTTP